MQPASERRLPLFPLFIVVVLAGLALGAFLSQRFSARSSSPPQFATHTPTSGPLITPTPLRRASLSLNKVKTRAVAPSRKPLPTPSISSLPSQSASPSRTPIGSTPRPVARVALRTPKPAAPKPVAVPAATRSPIIRSTPIHIARAAAPPPSQNGADAAAAVARDYLSALMRGDNRTANSLLGKSPSSLPEFPEQSFLTPSSHITDLHATPNGDGTYKVEAEVASPHGTFFVTFHISGNVITDHYPIKVQ